MSMVGFLIVTVAIGLGIAGAAALRRDHKRRTGDGGDGGGSSDGSESGDSCGDGGGDGGCGGD